MDSLAGSDKFLSDKRVEAAVNGAVKSLTDNLNPADLERELRGFAQTAGGGLPVAAEEYDLEQDNEAIRKKLDKVTGDEGLGTREGQEHDSHCRPVDLGAV
jgi:hypothetical protein